MRPGPWAVVAHDHVVPQHGAEGVVLPVPRRTVSRASWLVLLLALIVLVPAAPAAAATDPSAARVIEIATAQAGDPYIAGSTGPRGFDCSGLVYFAFREAGLLKRIGGSRKTAAGYLAWFQKRGKASRTNPQPGDLVVWNGGSHIGIYIGNGRAVSALVSGVQVRKVKAVTLPFTTYLHVTWPEPEGFKW